jgi:hypothetical protein
MDEVRLLALPEPSRGGAKLTEDQVRAIFDDKRLIREIAVEYGVSSAAISAIKNGRTWAHLKLNGPDYVYEVRSENNRRVFFSSARPDVFWKMVDIRQESECWPWLGNLKTKGGGYGQVAIDGNRTSASRAAWILSRGNPGDLLVLHDCHNPTCVNPAHLHLGTVADNSREMVDAGRGRGAHGEANNSAKLTAREVLAIRSDKRNQREIMAQYGISSSRVSAIRTRKSWRHLNEQR